MKLFVAVIIVLANIGGAFENDPLFQLWIGKTYAKQISSSLGEDSVVIEQSSSDVLDKNLITNDAKDINLMVWITEQMARHAYVIGNTLKRDMALAFDNSVTQKNVSRLIKLGFGLGFNRIIVYRGEACNTNEVEIFTNYGISSNETLSTFSPKYEIIKIRLSHPICNKARSTQDFECQIYTTNYVDEPCE